jgi:hypothetical protein
MVDKRRMPDVLEHHRHVLQPAYPPPWFQQTTSSSQQSSASPAQMTPRGAASRSRDTYGTPVAAKSRR